MHKIKRIAPLLLRWLIAIDLLTLVLLNIDHLALMQALQRFNPAYGVAMIAFNIASLSLMALRWHLIAAKLSIRATYLHYLRAIWLGALSGQIGPPLIFSEITRFKILQHHGDNKQLIFSQIVDRLSGQIILFLLLLLLLPIYLPLMAEAFPDRLLCLSLGFLIITAAVLFGLSRYRKRQNDKRYRQIIQLLNPLKSTSHYAISLLIQLLLMACFMLAGYGLGNLQQPLLFLALLPAVFISLSLFPISISDWGTREAAAVFFLSFAGLPAEDIVASSIIYGGIYSITTLIGLVFIKNNRGANEKRGSNFISS